MRTLYTEAVSSVDMMRALLASQEKIKGGSPPRKIPGGAKTEIKPEFCVSRKLFSTTGFAAR